MERTTKELSMADIAGWGSALVTFGLIQGALYLKAYWGHFGLDPFQYVAVSEIALAGLAGIGLALGMMFVAILLGDWLGNKLTSIGPDRRLLGFLAPAGLFLGLGAIIWWANAWAVLLGALLTVVCLAAVSIAPTVPAAIKKSPWLTYAVVMLVYVSIASNWLGAERAKKITRGEETRVANIRIESGSLSGLSLIGRLGDSYAFWDKARKATLLLPASELRSLEIGRGPLAETRGTD
ncbi:hypothetical protein ACGFZ3_16835 [Stenotrophomonas sp. NPDC047960]|uniref:hypothetical protein n=1 Tax=Stenotrophomonas sp. NPDC047960 TaxID=3364531 RepID=UPI00371038AD